MCAQAGATQTVLKVVQSCKQHDCVHWACSALANLVPNDSHACHAYDIELIVDLIGQNISPNWTLWHACKALAGLASMLDKPTRILVCQKACAIEVLMDILEQRDEAWLLAEACRVLAFLLQDNHVGHDTVECIYEMIMELFDRHDDDDLMQQVCALLGVLDVDRETDYAADQVLGVATWNSHNAGLVEQACRALANLASKTTGATKPDSLDKPIWHQAAEALVALARFHCKAAKLLRQVFRTLVVLADLPGTKQVCVEAGAVQALLDALAQHDDAEMLDQACQALAKMTTSPDTIRESKLVVEAMLDLVKRHDLHDQHDQHDGKDGHDLHDQPGGHDGQAGHDVYAGAVQHARVVLANFASN